ncbi:MAG: prepilin peptidase [Tyzzerella sp.]|nr:prepilin peptidase [Tyzzerella sp.]
MRILKIFAILCILLHATVTDFKKREVPYIYIILLILTALIDFRASNMLGCLLSVPFYFCQRNGRCMGGGDFMIVAALGFSVGLIPMFDTVVIGCIVYIIAGFAIEIVKGKGRLLFPFVPALTVGYIVATVLEVLI